MTYIPYRISELVDFDGVVNVRVVGYIEKEGKHVYLRDPLGEDKVRLLGRVEKVKEGEIVEVFGTYTPYGISVDFVLPADDDYGTLIEYKELIKKERERLLWINE